MYGLNSSGWTPKALTLEYLQSHHIDKLGPDWGSHDYGSRVRAAGCIAEDGFGTLPFQKTLARRFIMRRMVFLLAEKNARYWLAKKLLQQPGYKETYLPGERGSGVAGDVFKNPALGESLRQVAAHGRDAFYNGKLTDVMVNFLQQQGGTHVHEDFMEFEPEWVEPISTTYRGWTVYELPPNGQGVAALSMLNIMEKFPLASYGHNSPDALQVMIEAKKLAYADMVHYVGDPRFTAVPVKEMLSKDLGTERAKLVHMDKAACQVVPSELGKQLSAQGHSTIFLSTIDKDGNIVSLIQSNYAGYGTGMVAPGAGFSFHNRGAGFELVAGKPNSIAGHKRPLHTIIPAFMKKDDVTIGFGIMGGWNQAQAHAQFVANVVDFGMNVQAAMEAARFTKSTFEGCDLDMESRIPESVRQDLAKRGQEIKLLEPFSFTVGQGEAVMRDGKRGVNFAGADPRSDGEAIPESPTKF